VEVTPTQVTEQKIATDIANITGGVSQAITIISKVNTWTAICGFFTALPGLLTLAVQVINFLKSTFGTNWQSKVIELANALGDLNNAKTVEEKQNAAQALAKSIASNHN